MKKHIPVMLTLLVGIALGGACMFLVLGPAKLPSITDQEGATGDAKAKAADGDPVLAGQFAVTTGAAPGYIEDQACAECHQQLFDAYQQVGMAQSFSRPDADNLPEDFVNNHFVHAPTRRHYEMRRTGDELIFRRYQLDNKGQPINEFERQVDWILGSGKHARNYLYQTDAGELYQLPVAWYPQEKRWAMSAGFDGPAHEGVQRAIKRDCMFCHNAYPDVPAGSDAYLSANTFPKELPQGIGCQRCHGPGAEHVRVSKLDKSSAEKKRETIVNPARLSPQLRDDVCNQCHLQPTRAVAGMRHFGRDIYSYRPGEPLSDYLVDLDVVEESRDPVDRFEINHHAYRLRQSRCFLESPETMSCTTCHDAHHTVPQADRAKHYAAACVQCHKSEDCQLNAESGAHLQGIDERDCATCHMPKRRTQDVVHVVMTDHLIRKTPLDGSQLAALRESRRNLESLVLSLPDSKEGDDVYEMVHAAAMLRLSSYTLPDPANKLENVLAGLEPPEIEPFLDLTMAQLGQHRFAAARQTAAQILQRAPDHPLATEWMGTSLLSLKKSDAAAEHLRRTLEIAPNRAETHFNLGLLLLGQEKLDEARMRFERALELRPNTSISAYYLGVVLEQMDRGEEAVRAYERALQLEPAFGRAYQNLGQLLLSLNRRDDARRYLRHGIQVVAQAKPLVELFQEAEYAEVTPILSEAVRGEQLAPASAILVPVPIPDLQRLEPSVAKQITEFLSAFERLTSGASASASQVAEGYGMLAQLYHAYEFNEAAERCYVNTIRLMPKDDRSYHLLGALYQQVGELAAAESYLRMALELRPDNVAAVVRLGTINLQLNQPGKAREHFQKALEKSPDSAASHNGLGDLALAEKKYTEAITHFETALKHAPGANRIHYSLGMAYRGLGEAEKAKAELAKRGPVGVRPADPLVDALPQLLQGERVYLIRGQLAYSAGRFAEASAAYAKAIDANPDSVSGLTNYAAALSKQGLLRDAETNLRKALEIDAKNLAAHYNLASILAKLDEFEDSLTHYDVILEMAPEDLAVRRLRGGVLRQAGRTDEAIKEFEHILAKEPDDELTNVDLYDVLVEKREYARAIKLLSSSVEQFPDRGLSSSRLAKLLATCPDLELRNGAKAVELASKVVKAQQTPHNMETLAQALAEAGRCEEAAAIQEDLLAVAEELQKEDLIARLKPELVRYQAGAPCRPTGEAAETELPDAAPETEKEEPETDKPETDKPETDKPETDKPETDKPETDKPETDKPETDKPETDKPETDKPETEKRETEKPETEKEDAADES